MQNLHHTNTGADGLDTEKHYVLLGIYLHTLTLTCIKTT